MEIILLRYYRRVYISIVFANKRIIRGKIYMKKIISIILVTFLMFSMLTTNIFASSYKGDSKEYYTLNNVSSFKIEEYDLILNVREGDINKLKEDGYSFEEINFYRSNSIEKAILNRAKLSEYELINTYGYDKNQISILKGYHGESIEEYPQLKSVLGSCSGKVTCAKASKMEIAARLTWEWTTAPVLNGNSIKDIVAVRWAGTDKAGNPLNVAAVNKKVQSYCKLKTINAGKIKEHTYELDVNPAYAGASCTFRMEPEAGSGYWAKSGILQITVGATGESSINEIATHFSYGHTNISLSPTVSYKGISDIVFSVGVDTMFSYTNRIKSDGTVINY